MIKNRGMSYDKKYRKRVVEYREEGHTIEETAKTFKVGISSVRNWVKQYKETRNLENKPLKRGFKKIDPVKLEAHIESHRDAYLSEIAEVFDCSAKAVSKALKRLGITRKKRQSDMRSKIVKK